MFLLRLTPAVSIIMANIDDFFAKKDKKKKGTKKFSKANTDVIAQNLEESARKEQLQQDKDINNLGDEEQRVAQQVAEKCRHVLQIALQHFDFSFTRFTNLETFCSFHGPQDSSN